jgi:iron complex transport system substrate-binding protein
MKNVLHRAILPIAAALIATSAWAAEVTVRTYQGEVAVPENPEKIAVFDMAAADTLTALGVPIAGMPTPNRVSYLDDVAGNATAIGTLFEPDFESLAAMAPDLIVTGGRSSKQTKPLSRIAPAIDMTIADDDNGTLIENAKARLAAYGEIFGLQDKAANLQADFDAKIEETKAAVAGKGKALIILTNGPKVSAYGQGSRFGWIHKALDLPEAKENLETQTHGEAISFEFIADVNPDYLIVVDRGAAIGAEGESAAQTLDNELVAGTEAWKNGHVIYVDAAMAYIVGGGFQAMSGILDQIKAGFES